MRSSDERFLQRAAMTGDDDDREFRLLYEGDKPPWDRPLFYDRQGNPIDTMTYARLHSDMEYKRVAETTIGDWWVSTVWLGMDHGFHWEQDAPYRPVIFETMPFYQGDVPLDDLHPELRDLDQTDRRYRTEAEAIAGHDDACIEIRRLLENVRMADEVMQEAIDLAQRKETP